MGQENSSQQPAFPTSQTSSTSPLGSQPTYAQPLSPPSSSLYPSSSSQSTTAYPVVPTPGTEKKKVELAGPHLFKAGNVIQLTHCHAPEPHPFVFVVEHVQGRLCFALFQQRSNHLRIGQEGKVDVFGMQGVWAQFIPEYHGEFVALRSHGNELKGRKWYLGLTKHIQVIGTAGNDEVGRWIVKVFTPKEIEEVKKNITGLPEIPTLGGLVRHFAGNALRGLPAMLTGSVDSGPKWFEDAKLTSEQLKFFQINGYLHLQSVVPLDVVNAALAKINRQLGDPEGGMTTQSIGMGLNHPVLSGGVGTQKTTMDLLYNSPAFTYAQRLIGKGKVGPVFGGQIALIFPQERGPFMTNPLPGTQWHIDGFGKGLHSPFTLLLGVTLSEAASPLSGNFTVFPGSHLSLQSKVKEIIERDDGSFSMESLADKPNLGTPVQILAKPGDIVLAHQKLAHRGGPNFSPHIRYQVYFRLSHIQHEELKQRALDNVFTEFEGVPSLETKVQSSTVSTSGSSSSPSMSSTTSGSPVISSPEVLQLRSMFPSIPLEKINAALKANNGNLEAAANTLLL